MTDREAFESWWKQDAYAGDMLATHEANIARAAWQAALASERAKQVEPVAFEDDLRNIAQRVGGNAPAFAEKIIAAPPAAQAEPVAWTGQYDENGNAVEQRIAAPPAVQQAEPLNSAIYKIAASLAMGEPMRPLNAVLDTGKSSYQQTCNAAEKVADRLRVIAMQLRNAVDATPPADDEAVRLLREAKDYLDRWEARPSLQLAIDSYLAKVKK